MTKNAHDCNCELKPTACKPMCEQRVSVTNVDEWNHHSVLSLDNEVQAKRTGRERGKKETISMLVCLFCGHEKYSK